MKRQNIGPPPLPARGGWLPPPRHRSDPGAFYTMEYPPQPPRLHPGPPQPIYQLPPQPATLRLHPGPQLSYQLPPPLPPKLYQRSLRPGFQLAPPHQLHLVPPPPKENIMREDDDKKMAHIPLARYRVLYLGSAVPTETAQGIESFQQPLRER